MIKRNEIFVSILVSSSHFNIWLATYGTKYLISGLVSCISLLQIFVAEVMQAIVEKRKMRLQIVISGILGTIGIVCLCNQQLVGVEDMNLKNTILGIFFSFMATVAAAFGNLIYEKSSNIFRKMPRATFMLYNCFFGAIILLIIGLIINPVSELSNPAMKDIKYLAVFTYLSLTVTVISLFALYYIIEKQGAVKSTYINFILPILSMLISTIVEGFKWNYLAIFGMIVLLYSVWIGIKQDVNSNREKLNFKEKMFHILIK